MRAPLALGVLATAWTLLQLPAYADENRLLLPGTGPESIFSAMPGTTESVPFLIGRRDPVQADDPPSVGLAPAAPMATPTPTDDGITVQEAFIPEVPFRTWERFYRRQTEWQIMSGALFFPINGLGPGGRDMIMLPQLVRFGFMANDSNPDRRRMKGTIESISEFITVPIVKGPGSILIGYGWYGRYNFTTQFEHLVPYFELGGGGSYTDSYKDKPSNLATGFEFILHYGMGARYVINRKWSLVGELDYYHFSDAGIAKHNYGVNAFGGTLGFTRFIH